MSMDRVVGFDRIALPKPLATVAAASSPRSIVIVYPIDQGTNAPNSEML